MPSIDLVGRRWSISATLRAIRRLGRRSVSAMSARRIAPGSAPMRRYASAARMPVRLRISTPTAAEAGMPAWRSVTCTGRSDEFDTAQHGDLAEAGPAGDKAADLAGDRSRLALDRHRLEAEIGRLSRPPGSAPDRLVDPPAVVGEQVPGAVDDGRRAAIVDLEGVLGGAGEEAPVVDQVLRRGAGVAVDDLVVVADAEDVVGGCAQGGAASAGGPASGPGTRRRGGGG